MNRLIFLCTVVFTYNTTATPFSIDSTVIRSDSCVAIEWTPDSSNTDSWWYTQYGNQCNSSDSIYRHCDFITGRTYKGIAYSYGGEDPWYTFRDHLAAGYLVGSHQCHFNVFGDPSGRVTGTDCSGFLCFVWNIPRTTTTGLYNNNQFITVPINNAQAGDALVKASSAYGYHAILIVEAEDLTETVISEASSTVFGCRERVVDLTRPEWSPYKVIRNPALQTQQIVTSSNTSFPEFRLVRLSGGQITLHLSLLTPAQLCGYDLNGTQLFKKQLNDSGNNCISINSRLGSRVIYLSLQTKQTIIVSRLSLL